MLPGNIQHPYFVKSYNDFIMFGNIRFICCSFNSSAEAKGFAQLSLSNFISLFNAALCLYSFIFMYFANKGKKFT